jgi:flagellar protein FliO/FliZ
MEAAQILRAIGAFLFVMALLGGCGWLLKRYGHKLNLIGAMPGTGSKRLRVQETLALDPRRRLILIKRDDVEHLILVGPDGQLVVEGNIRAEDAKL